MLADPESFRARGRAGHRALSLLALAVLLGCVGADTHAPDVSPRRAGAALDLVATRLPGLDEDVLVGTLLVPENRALPGGRTIPLHVVLIPARRPAAGRPPLFFVDGGPGVAATSAAEWYLDDLSRFREERDVILVDVRGTGASGGLQIGPRDESPLLDAFCEMFPPDWVSAGRAALQARADLTCYTTEDVVDDLEDVRAALGCERIDLHGLSYGTRVVLGYLRRHAGRVHAAILQGTAPAALRMPMHHAPAAQRALLARFAECAADPAAEARFGDLAAKLAAVLERLQAAPEHVAFRDPETGVVLDVEIRADVFAEKLRSLLYSSATSRVVPLLVQRAFEGSFETLLRLQGGGPGGLAFSDGFYLCVTCSEDVPFIDGAQAERLAQDTFFGDYRVEQQRRACASWPRAAVPADFFDPVVAETPVLVLCGGLDPVTPAAFAEEVASHLPNARLVTIPRMAHIEDGLSHLDCLEQLELDFLDRGSAEGLDLSCVETMLPGPFVLDESELPFPGG